MALTKPEFMAPGVGKKNYLINGDMSVSQRGASGASNAAHAYTVDRWKAYQTGSYVWGWAQTSVAAKPASADRLINYCLRLSCTTADTAVAASDYFQLVQHIEGQVFAPLWQHPTTLSFWVRSSEAGTYCAHLRNGGYDRSYVQEFTIDSADTWEYKELQFTVHPTAGTWDTTTSLGITVGITLMAGTNFQTTANEWSNGNFIATSNQVNWCSNATNTFDLALVQYERGNSATPYQTRDLATETRDCKRYYEQLGGTASGPHGMGLANTTSGAIVVINYEVEKRTTPAVTYSAASDFQVLYAGDTVDVPATITSTATSVERHYLKTTHTGTPLTAGQALLLRSIDTTAAIYISAEF